MSLSENQPNPVDKQAEYIEDEIELIDLLRVIWKWKYLIIGGTAICAVVALVISLLLPKIYRIETVIRPGILNIGEEGKYTFIDTPENIKALIETGIFDNEILNSLSTKGVDNSPKILQFNITLPNNSSTIKVGYESADVDQGIEILSLLGKNLTGEYRNLVNYYQNEITRDINIKKAEIQNTESIKQSSQSNIKNIEKRIYELETELVLINENTIGLNKERNTLLSRNNDENSVLSVLLYSNTIQQNLQLANEYKDEIKNLKFEKESQLQIISKLNNELQILLAEIENLKFKKNSIQNIQIVRKPASNSIPVKPKNEVECYIGCVNRSFFAWL